MTLPWTRIRGVVWDWGDTLMRDFPGEEGPMVDWPRVEAMPGAAEALEALSGLDVQCVATNATDSTSAQVAEALGRAGLLDHLDRFFTSGELGTSKPDPGFFLAIARELELPPQALVSIGNSLAKDIRPARHAGMSTILVDPNPDPGAAEDADLVVPDLPSLVALFPLV